MALIGGMSFAGGMFFFLLGAWPVIGFLGLDVLLVYWAFRANYRAAAAYEEVTVTPSELQRAPGQPSRRGQRMDAQSGVDAARPREARGIRPAAAVPGVARAQAAGRGLPVAARRRKASPPRLLGRAGEAKRGPTRAAILMARNRVGLRALVRPRWSA